MNCMQYPNHSNSAKCHESNSNYAIPKFRIDYAQNLMKNKNSGSEKKNTSELAKQTRPKSLKPM